MSELEDPSDVRSSSPLNTQLCSKAVSQPRQEEGLGISQTWTHCLALSLLVVGKLLTFSNHQVLYLKD